VSFECCTEHSNHGLNETAPQTLFFGLYGLSFDIKGAPSLRLNFFSKSKRDKILESLIGRIEALASRHSGFERDPQPRSSVSSSTSDQVQPYRHVDYHSIPPLAVHSLPRFINVEESYSPAPLKIYCMTIGSRGDVRSFTYLAFSMTLMFMDRFNLILRCVKNYLKTGISRSAAPTPMERYLRAL
jgi:hypothetical protein